MAVLGSWDESLLLQLQLTVQPFSQTTHESESELSGQPRLSQQCKGQAFPLVMAAMRAGAFHTWGRWQPSPEQGTGHPSFSYLALGEGTGHCGVTVCAVVMIVGRAMGSDL